VGIAATLGAGSTTSFQVLDQAGVPASGVSAVPVDLEANGASAGGYVTPWARHHQAVHVHGEYTVLLKRMPGHPRGYIAYTAYPTA
jgi:hypothetical protein